MKIKSFIQTNLNFSQKQEKNIFISILMLAFLFSFLSFNLFQNKDLFDTTQKYLFAARDLAKDGQLNPDRTLNNMMPIYPVFLALFIKIFGENSLLLSVIFSLIHVGTVYFTYRLSRLMLPPRIALIPPLFLSIHPYIAKLTVQIIDTGPSVLLSTAAVFFLMKMEKNRSYTEAITAGSAFAIATLVRPVAGVALFALAAAFLARTPFIRDKKREVLVAFLLLISWAIVMSPWWIFMAQRTGEFSLLTRHGGKNMLKGHTENYVKIHPKYDTDHFPYVGIPDNNQEKSSRKLALEYIQKNPSKAFITDLKKIVWSYWIYKTPRSFTNSKARWDEKTQSITDVPNLKVSFKDKIYTIYWTPILIFMLIGLIFAIKMFQKYYLFFVLIAANGLTIMLTFADTRYRLEVESLLLILAALGINQFMSLIKEKISSAG